jgi:CRP-like cAMP-binding protein
MAGSLALGFGVSVAPPEVLGSKIPLHNDPLPQAASDDYVALDSMEQLFVAGEDRDKVYRVEAGVLLVSTAPASGLDGDCRVVQAGGYVGLGFLSEHTTSAYAFMPSIVRCLSMPAVKSLAVVDKEAQAQLSRDVSREFDTRRAMMRSDSDRASPKQRVARLLVALSSMASQEGRTLHAVSENLECTFIASLLGLSVTVLTDTIDEFISLGIVRKDRVTGTVSADVSKLLALSDSASQRH